MCTVLSTTSRGSNKEREERRHLPTDPMSVSGVVCLLSILPQFQSFFFLPCGFTAMIVHAATYLSSCQFALAVSFIMHTEACFTADASRVTDHVDGHDATRDASRVTHAESMHQ